MQASITCNPDFPNACFHSEIEWYKSMCAPPRAEHLHNHSPAKDVPLQVPCAGLGCDCDTQIFPPESTTTKKEKDADGKKEKDTDGDKEKKKGLDVSSCHSEGVKHSKNAAEKHREKHKER